MSSPLDPRDPPPQPPHRSASTWALLLLVWTAGTILCLVQFAAIGWVVLSIL